MYMMSVELQQCDTQNYISLPHSGSIATFKNIEPTAS